MVSATKTTNNAINIWILRVVEKVRFIFSAFPSPKAYVRNREDPVANAPFINERNPTIPPTA